MWQDLAITASAIILTLSMLPIVFNKGSKVPFWGSFPTAFILFPVYVVIFITLNLPISAITIGLEGLFWWFIVIRRRLK